MQGECGATYVMPPTLLRLLAKKVHYGDVTII